MLLSKKQRLILLGAGGFALLLLIGLLALIRSGRRADAARPSPSPSPTASASPAPSASPTPFARPTQTPVYRLPLVPFSDAQADPFAPSDAPASLEPSAPVSSDGGGSATPSVPSGTVVFPSQTPPPSQTPGPDVFLPSEIQQGRFDAGVREFLTVGVSDGVPVALLLIRLAPPDLCVLSIPCEALPAAANEAGSVHAGAMKTASGFSSVSAQLSESIAALCGRKMTHWVTVDLACMPAMIDAVPPLSGGGLTFDRTGFSALMQTEGKQRAYGMGALGVGIAEMFSAVYPWEIPKLKQATKGKITTELSVWELFLMAAAVRGIERTQLYVLPMDETAGTYRCNRAETEKLFQKIFK